MVAQAIPTTFEALTPAWLTEKLHEGGHLGGAVVTAVEWTPVGQGVGVLCQLARLALTYDRPAPDAPHTLVVKLPSPSEQTRAMAHAFQFYPREVTFYQELGGAVGLNMPRAYYSTVDPATQDFALLLEDMGRARMADQLVGCSEQDATLAVTELPKLHAPWWNSPRLGDLAWLPVADSPVNKIGLSFYPQAWLLFLQQWGDRLTPRLRAVGERMASAGPQIFDRFAVGPRTICHGDYRGDNMFFGDGVAAPPLTVVDWQISIQASGVYDVGYFLTQSVDVGVRRALERDLLRRYHEGLLAGGVRDYSFDECVEDYRWTALFCIVYPIIGGGLGDLSNERGVALVAAMFDRCAAAILDWDADKLLDRL